VFEVSAEVDGGLHAAVPLKAMGRFAHEAAVVDPRTDIVYLTEDDHESLLYRFIPTRRGNFAAGGRLEALGIAGLPGVVTRERHPLRTPLAVSWIPLDDPESPDGDLRKRGRALGAAVFDRGEGMCIGRDGVYFTASEGGPSRFGQLWLYAPSHAEGTAVESEAPGRLTLFAQPDDPAAMEMPDNLTLTPWGDCLFCEDKSSRAGDHANRIGGVTSGGRPYVLARNRGGDGEFAGACFAPDGAGGWTLFVNIQQAGLTLAIAGPFLAR
jgi:secreted PhoX family phosphatase